MKRHVFEASAIAVLFSVVMLCGCPSPTDPADSSAFDDSNWWPGFAPMGVWGDTHGGSNRVTVLARWNENLVAGGTFLTAGGEPAGRVALWDGVRWRALGQGLNGKPTALLGTIAGGLFAAGDFTTADGDPALNVARFAGNRWHAMGDGILRPPTSLCLYNGSVYAGGMFPENAEDTWPPVGPIARWDGLTWHFDFHYGWDIWTDEVFALEDFWEGLFLGGSFEYSHVRSPDTLPPDGTPARNLLRWGWNNTLHQPEAYPVGDGLAPFTPYAMINIGGTLYAGGSVIAPAGGGPAYNVVAVSSSYSYTPLPAPPVCRRVRAMTEHQGWLVVAMGDTHDEVVQRYGIGPGWQALGGNFARTVRTVAAVGERLYAGGDFDQGVVAWDEGQWVQVGGGIGRPGLAFHDIRALVQYGNDLVAGGEFTLPSAVEGVASQNVARWNGRFWHYLDRGTNFPVHALAVYQGDLIAGGAFTMAGDQPRSHIARWDGSAWHDMGGTASQVHALAVWDGELIVGGSFTQAGGVSAARIARWNGSTWSAMGAGFNGAVRALTVHDGELYAAGDFTLSGSASVQRVARWSGTQWLPLGDGLNDAVLALASHAGALYAGGRFTASGGAAADRLARWHNDRWEAVGGGGFAGGAFQLAVTALRSVSGNLYVGGNFTSVGDLAAGGVAVWTGSAWQGLGTGVHGGYDPNATVVLALLPFGGDLYLGGNFYQAGVLPSIYMARWLDGSLE